MAWIVELLDHRVQRELLDQPLDIQAQFVRIAELIRDKGPFAVGPPDVKHLQRELWEMRMRGRDGIAKAIYVVVDDQRVTVVRIFTKKTEKTPPKELRLAQRRAKEVES